MGKSKTRLHTDGNPKLPKHPAGQLANFRIYPEKTCTLFFRVRMFASIKAMLAYIKLDPERAQPGGRCRGLCSAWTEIIGDPKTGKVSYYTKELGEILLLRNYSGAGIVTHELMHAVFAYFQRHKLQMPCRVHDADKKREWASDDEERACHVMGWMAHQIYVKIRAAGIEARSLS